jgi:pimeloyl-ACP methyl ester carboxylesterase/DNA-binding SARP family transcriptional activator
VTNDGLRLALLGPLEISREGRPLALPPSKKTRALLGYLIATGRPHARDRLCTLLWDVADDPRGALRWSVSKLRVLLDDEAPRIVADRDSVRFDGAGAAVDVTEVGAALAGLGGMDADRLRGLLGCFRGPFLEGLDLPDFHDYQAWYVAERERWRMAHLRLLRALVERLEDEPGQAADVARDIVRLAPEEEGPRATLVRLLMAAGRKPEAEAHYQMGLEQLEKVGSVAAELRGTWRQATAPAPRPPRPGSPPQPSQIVRFCTAPDGVRLAYATHGRGPPLVKAPNWLGHIEYDWKSPLWRHLARELGDEHTMVRFDQRGSGLSDWRVEDISFPAFVSDLETVVDAAGLDRFALLGISQGCAISIAYAALHPERVSHLILYGGYAVGWERGPRRDGYQAMMGMMEYGWGANNPTFRQVFTTLFIPEATGEQVGWFNELQQVSASAETAARILKALGPVDVRPQLARVTTPTLVLHTSKDAVVPFEEGRAVAAGIPGARFVALEGRNHLLLEDEPAWPRFVSEVRGFLAGG